MKEFFKKTAVITAILLALLVINRLIIGNTFTYRMNNPFDSCLSYKVTFEEDDVFEVVHSEMKNGTLSVTLKGLRPGSTQVSFTIYGDNNEYQTKSTRFYAHSSGFITMNSYIGTTNRFYIIGIEIVLLLLGLLLHRIWLCVKTQRENMYSYALPGHMGVALFLFVTLVLFTMISLRQGADYYDLSILVIVLEMIFMLYAILSVPILLVLAAFLLVSNLILIKREGKSLTNMLGILLGSGLIGMTLFGVFFSYMVLGIKVGYGSSGYYFNRFFDAFFFSVPVYLECLMASTLVCTLKVQKFVPSLDKDYIIILGCAIKKDGTLTPLLKGRADRALWFAKRQKEETGRDIIFVPSGGKGDDEVISEAQAITNYLLECGVDREHILPDDKSANTRENMEFSKQLIEKHSGSDARVSFSTTGYHVFRSGNIARSAGLYATGLGSKTKWYFYVNALIREFAANLSAEKGRHIFNMLALMIYAILITWIGSFTG